MSTSKWYAVSMRGICIKCDTPVRTGEPHYREETAWRRVLPPGSRNASTRVRTGEGTGRFMCDQCGGSDTIRGQTRMAT